MASASLVSNLLANAGFQRQLRALTIESVAQQFPLLTREINLFSAVYDWKYLLLCASVLAQSDRAVAQAAALRIAQHSLVSDNTSRSEKTAACVVLDTLTNQPALQLAVQRSLIPENYVNEVPMPLRLDWIQRGIHYSIVRSDDTILHANRFQHSLWHGIADNEWISVSAPTSAGKSYLLLNWLAEFLADHPRSLIVYVVPTRALIQQVQVDLEAEFVDRAVTNVKVSSLPLAAQISADGSTVFVLTQERLHILLNNLPSSIRVNALVIDEAQKIGDGARGVLLQTVLEATVSSSAPEKVVFASPATSNPELLLETAPKAVRATQLESAYVAVNQNLIWASPVPHTDLTWNAELCLDRALVLLGTFDLPFRPITVIKRIAFAAFAMGKASDRDGGNLVYANGAAEAEKIALQLHELQGRGADVQNDTSIADLISLVKKTVHKDYRLAIALERGVAFHYGNMPLLIRNEIERLFRENVIHFLVCTSTLIEGVNLPAKSIFVRGPRKGKGRPMNRSDFWNLAGRAGRLGKEFQGNVICIDPRDTVAWPEAPPLEREPQKIERSSDLVLADSDTFVSYVRGEKEKVPTRQFAEYDHVLGYLFRNVLQYGSLKDSPFATRQPQELVAKLDAVLAEASTGLKTPRDIIERNPGISPLAMDGLLEYFTSYTKPVEQLFPLLPENSDAATALKKIFDRINKYISPTFGSGNRVMALAILVVNWMRGWPLARIISDRESRNPDKQLPGTIRDAMEDVEQVARFLAPKYVACYTDILRFVLLSTDRSNIASAIPDLTLWMEFGASAKTQLSLMSLGLSRTSAIEVSELIASDSLDENECLQWLREHDLPSLDLPIIVEREVRRILGQKVRISSN